MRKFEISCAVEEYAGMDELPVEWQMLVAAATTALDSAYAPYSQFRVGAALLLENGTLVTGSNQENAAYPSGLCAERTAFFAAGHQYPGERILAVAITTSYPMEKPIAPCGACRQVMAEYELKQDSGITVLMTGSNGKIFKVGSVRELLPMYFSGEWLKKDSN